jgi:hypothetical protein
MKTYKRLCVIIALLATAKLCCAQSHGTYALPSEYDGNFESVCNKAQTYWALEMETTQNNLATIYSLLKFSSYKIDVVMCDKIHSSALAYLNPQDGNRYILINKKKLTDLHTRYNSHLFVIAHEFFHHKLNHLDRNTLLTTSTMKQCELDADYNAAIIVKNAGGTLEDCITALNQMAHPSDDTYESHPVKSKRIAIVQKAFSDNKTIILPEETVSPHTDFLPDIKSVAWLRYSAGLKKFDINNFYNKTKMIPTAITWHKDSYWLFWQKNSLVSGYSMLWNYPNYPSSLVEEKRNEGYNIEFVEKLNNKWFVVLLKYTTQFGQRIEVIRKSEFNEASQSYKDKIQSNLSDGYSLQNIVDYDLENYLVLLTRLDGAAKNYYSWTFRPNYDDFKNWYSTRGSDYNYMYCRKFINGSHFGFMLNSDKIADWKILAFDGTDINPIAESLKDGYSVDNITGDQDYIRFTLVKRQ